MTLMKKKKLTHLQSGAGKGGDNMIYGFIIEWYDPNSEDLATIYYTWETRCPMYTIKGIKHYKHRKLAEQMLQQTAARLYIALHSVERMSRAITGA